MLNLLEDCDRDSLSQYLALVTLQRQKADEESKKQVEIEALQKQLQQLKDMAAGKTVSIHYVYLISHLLLKFSNASDYDWCKNRCL